MTVAQLVLSYYQLLPNFYWRWLYKTKMMPGAELSFAQFRDLYSYYHAYHWEDKVKYFQRRLLYLPFHVLNPLSDFLQSHWFEDRRLDYARYFNLYIFRQYLNYSRDTGEGIDTIWVESCDHRSSVTFLTLYHDLRDRTNMVQYAKERLHRHFQIPTDAIRTKRLDKHHLKVVYSQE